MRLRTERRQRHVFAGDGIQFVHQPGLGLRYAGIRYRWLTLRPHLLAGQEGVPRRPHQSVQPIPVDALREHSRLTAAQVRHADHAVGRDFVRVVQESSRMRSRLVQRVHVPVVDGAAVPLSCHDRLHEAFGEQERLFRRKCPRSTGNARGGCRQWRELEGTARDRLLLLRQGQRTGDDTCHGGDADQSLFDIHMLSWTCRPHGVGGMPAVTTTVHPGQRECRGRGRRKAW